MAESEVKPEAKSEAAPTRGRIWETTVTVSPVDTKAIRRGVPLWFVLASTVVSILGLWVGLHVGREDGWNDGYNHACNKFFGRAKRLNLLSQEHDAVDDLESEGFDVSKLRADIQRRIDAEAAEPE